MGLSAVMEMGKSGLNVYRVATEVTGENIANVNTPGYSRQRVILETAPPATSNGFPLGSGVTISTVERYYDGLLQQQLVNANTTTGYDSTKSQVLQQIEPTFNEITQDGLGTSISNFFSAWQDLSSNPSGSAERQGVLSRAQILADNFQSVSTTLNNTITTQDQALKPLTDDINSTINNIAQLNGQIQQTELVSGNANELRDQRDLLIQQLAENMGIKYTENSNGTTDVYVQNGATKNYLVQGTQTGSLATGGTTPATTVTITDVAGATVAVDPLAATPLYTAPDGGALWATMQMRDITIPSYLSKVDELANQVATQVNTLHQAGFDINGDPGGAFFSGTTAGTIAVNITNSDNIAAAGSAATAPGGNDNALAIANLQNTTIAFTSGTTTISNYYDALVSKVGLDVKSAKTVQSQDEAFTKQLSTLRDSNSGVSLDEELTNLVMYQRSYQASAKLITAASEMMDTVIGMIR